MESTLFLEAIVRVQLVELRENHALAVVELWHPENGELLGQLGERELCTGDSVEIGPVKIPVTMSLTLGGDSPGFGSLTEKEAPAGQQLPQQGPMNTLTPSTPQTSPETGGQREKPVDTAPSPARHAGALTKRNRGR